MKKEFLTLTTIVLIATACSTAFGQENKKGEDACKNIVEIKDEKKLIKSRLDADADYKKYTKEADIKILANRKRIAYLKANKSNNNKYTKDKYEEIILTLEQRNDTLKNMMYESFMTKTCAWPAFKAEFDEEMSKLELAIKDIEDDNKKAMKD